MTTAAPTTDVVKEPGSMRPTALLARTFDITQGQAATVILALVIAAVLTLAGLPPVLRNRNAGDAEPISQQGPAPLASPSDEPAAAPSQEPAAPVLSGGAALSSTAPASSSTASESTQTSSPSAERSGAPTPATGEIAAFAAVDSPGAPEGLAVDEDGNVYVATNNGATQGEPGPSKIFSYDPSGSAARTYTISGQPEAHDLGITGLALDGDGGLIALDAATARILRIDLANGRQSTLSELIDLPACGLVVAAPSGCEPGVQDGQPEPRGAVFDASGNLYVTDAAQGIVWRVPAGGGDPEPWLAHNSFGSGTGLSGVAIGADGAVLVASPQSLDPAAALGGAVYKIAVDGAGKAGTPELVVMFPMGEEPAGIAALTDGSLVVALRGANAIVLVDAAGEEVRRVEGGEGPTALDAPTGVAFQGSTLLVSNQAPATKAAWAVLAVGIR